MIIPTVVKVIPAIEAICKKYGSSGGASITASSTDSSTAPSALGTASGTTTGAAQSQETCANSESSASPHVYPMDLTELMVLLTLVCSMM